jgi:hypothetical protein
MMWAKRKKREEEDKEEEIEKQYVTGDTPLGRYYNKALNKRFSEEIYSDALSYEMLRQIDKKVDLYGKRTEMLEARVVKLEQAAKGAGGYVGTFSNAHPKPPALILSITKDYNAKLGDFVHVDTTDGPVIVTLPRIDKGDNGDAILIKKMDRSENVIIVRDIEGQGIGTIHRQYSYQVKTVKRELWAMRYKE